MRWLLGLCGRVNLQVQLHVLVHDLAARAMRLDGLYLEVVDMAGKQDSKHHGRVRGQMLAVQMDGLPCKLRSCRECVRPFNEMRVTTRKKCLGEDK
jgi:hypothetical protein